MQEPNKQVTEEQPRLTPQEAEQNEIDTLIDRGMEFKVGKRSFVIHQPYYGTLDHLANIFIKMEVNMDKLDEDGALEAKKMAAKYSKLCAEAVAVAVLRTKWRIRLFKRPLAQYFYWHITPRTMRELARRINAMLNMLDFTHSIVSMSATRTTMPETMEGKTKA